MTNEIDLGTPGHGTRTPSCAELEASYGPADDLAADSTSTNDDRADWARDALATFMVATGNRDGLDDAEVLDYVVADLVCDLMHLVCRAGLDPDLIIERGRHHFTSEAALGYEGSA